MRIRLLRRLTQREADWIVIRSASLHLRILTFGVMIESSVGQRFSQLIQQLGMSKNAFAMSLDKTATVIQHLVDERNKPGFDLMCKVFEVYPNVSKDWLLLGKGPMLLTDATDSLAAEAPLVATPVAQAKPATAAVTAPTPSFPAPLFAVSTARPPLPEGPALPAEPSASPTSPAPKAAVTDQSVSPLASALGGVAPEFQSATPAPLPAPRPAVSSASLDAAALTAALHAQYLQHQLALAEQRNQHLLEQQKLMQQMLDLLRRPV